ncbi:MAG: hypothetical protein R3D68_05940 [Hyphomicrobiaceae bacterium]
MRLLKWLSGRFARLVLGNAASAARQVLDREACLAYPPRLLAGVPSTAGDAPCVRQIGHLTVLRGGKSELPAEFPIRREIAATLPSDNHSEPQEPEFLNARLRKRVKN